MQLSPLELAAFLALAAKSIADGLLEPINQKFPNMDLWWMVYIEWVLGGALAFLAGVNLFSAVLPNALAGQILTAIVVGGGAKLIFKVFNK